MECTDMIEQIVQSRFVAVEESGYRSETIKANERMLSNLGIV